MVGWYHTHPDWGVFLSSMDMFICDNFFNKLDVAYVIDPWRGPGDVPMDRESQPTGEAARWIL
jgi:proteasome lid subunit RPN8/RPN11